MNNPTPHLFVLMLCLLTAPLMARADAWLLDGEQSSLSFVSLKNVDVAEAHRFKQLSGQLDESGHFTLTVDLDSVDTSVPIRDERMREHVFAGESAAIISGQVDTTVLKDLGVGRSTTMAVQAELDFRGQKTPLLAQLRVSAIEGNQLQVVTTSPILVSARNLGVANGIEKLRELAALTSISMAVPVYLSLTFRREP